jgi:hypothetical protein
MALWHVVFNTRGSRNPMLHSDVSSRVRITRVSAPSRSEAIRSVARGYGVRQSNVTSAVKISRLSS